MVKTVYKLYIALGLVILGGIGAFFMPAPLALPYSSSIFAISFAINAMTTLLYLAAGYFLLSGLKNFRTGLRHSFILIAVGMALQGALYISIPFATLLNWWVIPIYGLLVNGAMITGLLIYLGVRKLAHLTAVKNITTSLWAALLMIVGLSLVAINLPHPDFGIPEPLFDFTAVAKSAIVVWLIFALGATVYIRKHTSGAYISFTRWLFIGLGAWATTEIIFMARHFFLPIWAWRSVDNLALFGCIVAGGALLYAAYRFNCIGRKALAPPAGFEIKTSADILLYTASLASSSRDVDPILDKLRKITANMKSEAEIKQHNQHDFETIYLQLEQYLVEQEPLRKYTQSEVRLVISQLLSGQKAEKDTFWPALQQKQTSRPGILSAE